MPITIARRMSMATADTTLIVVTRVESDLWFEVSGGGIVVVSSSVEYF